MTWMWDAVWKVLQHQRLLSGIISTLTSSMISVNSPKSGETSVVVTVWVCCHIPIHNYVARYILTTNCSSLSPVLFEALLFLRSILVSLGCKNSAEGPSTSKRGPEKRLIEIEIGRGGWGKRWRWRWWGYRHRRWGWIRGDWCNVRCEGDGE